MDPFTAFFLNRRRRRRIMMTTSLIVIALTRLKSNTRTRHYLTRISLLPPAASPGVHLVAVEDNGAYIDTFGFSVQAFDYLHHHVQPLIIKAGNNGRPMILDSRCCLAMTSQYLNSVDREKALAQIYGVTPTTVGKYIAKTMTALTVVLPTIHSARILWPGAIKMAKLSALVSQKCRGFDNIFGFVDGCRLLIKRPDDPLVENAYYSRTVADHCINNIIVFQPDGCICWVRSNAAGAKSDVILSDALYGLLEDINRSPRPFVILGDSAFSSNRMRNLILTPFKEGDRLNSDPNVRALQLAMNAKITSHRQAVEWGNGALQRTFARLSLRLTSDPVRRQNLLFVIFHLFNMRTRLTAFNQIKTVYSE